MIEKVRNDSLSIEHEYLPYGIYAYLVYVCGCMRVCNLRTSILHFGTSLNYGHFPTVFMGFSFNLR